MLNVSAKIDLTHVPYRGTAPALNDLLGGQIPLIWATPNALVQFVEAGKVKPLAAASLERIAILPQVPTINESALPGFNVGVWFGIAAPAKTPREVTDRLAKEIGEITKTRRRAEAIVGAGLRPQFRRQRALPQPDRDRSQALRHGHPRSGNCAELGRRFRETDHIQRVVVPGQRRKRRARNPFKPRPKLIGFPAFAKASAGWECPSKPIGEDGRARAPRNDPGYDSNFGNDRRGRVLISVQIGGPLFREHSGNHLLFATPHCPTLRLRAAPFRCF